MMNDLFLNRYDLLPKGTHVLCALSGGRDSVYLLYRLLELAEKRGLTVSAAHYNHRLRGEESQRDEDFVRELCETLGVPLTVGHGDVSAYAAEQGLGMEEAARVLRYDFLEQARREMQADVIATAHHADDLGETMLFQLARGAGTKGLAGIPPCRDHIIRPLLLTTREEIDGYLTDHDISFVEDSTNALDVCARNVIRNHIVPLLESLNPAFAAHAARSAMLLREDELYLQSVAEDFLQVHPASEGIPASDLRALPWPIASRVVRTVWGAGLTAEHVKKVLTMSGSGVSYVHLPGATLRLDRGRLWTHVSEALPDIVLSGESGCVRRGNMVIRWKRMINDGEIHNSFNTFVLKCENIEDVVTVTSRRDGDRVKLVGRSHTKRLKQLFQEHDLTQPQRAAVPVIRDEQGIAAVYGFGVAQRCVAEVGEKIICIRCEEYRENGE